MIFDAGALLAILYDEPGAEDARGLLLTAKMSAVNRAEVITVLVRDGMPVEEADQHVETLLANVIPFDKQISTLVASLWPNTSPLGLSLGDRACLALALHLREPVLTTDSTWKKLDFPLEIRFLR
jgi:ribonuclease VapC